eukprot:TRINITY_DN4748_c2_g1_i1.p1 TRINITY_DN4748_c2_g1~~TRINITY_DN4748_c2_g1_i1.p1  ORF type:complete len:707 (+),score=120.62 TRINITY_DN4748_c2_g1_i1:39-2123(+)
MLRQIDRYIEEGPGRHLGGVGYKSNKAVGEEASIDYLDPILNVEEIRMDFVRGVKHKLPWTVFRGMTRLVYVKKGGLSWIARHPDVDDSFGVTKEGEICVFRSACGGMIKEKEIDEIYDISGGRLHAFDIWIKDPPEAVEENPSINVFKQNELKYVEGTGWYARVLCGNFRNNESTSSSNLSGLRKAPGAIHHNSRARIIEFSLTSSSHTLTYKVPSSWTCMAFVFEGEIEFQHNMKIVKEGSVVVFEQGGEVIEAWSQNLAAKFLLIASPPSAEMFHREGSVVGETSSEVEEFMLSDRWRSTIEEHDAAIEELENEEIQSLNSTFQTTTQDEDRRRRGKAFSKDVLQDASEPKGLGGRRQTLPSAKEMSRRRSMSPVELRLARQKDENASELVRSKTIPKILQNRPDLLLGKSDEKKPKSQMRSQSPPSFASGPRKLFSPSSDGDDFARTLPSQPSSSKLTKRRGSSDTMSSFASGRDPNERRQSVTFSNIVNFDSLERSRTEYSHPMRRASGASGIFGYSSQNNESMRQLKRKTTSCMELKERLNSLQSLKDRGTPGLDNAIVSTQKELEEARQSQIPDTEHQPTVTPEEMQKYESEWNLYSEKWTKYLNQLYANAQKHPDNIKLKSEYQARHKEFQIQLQLFQQRQRKYEALYGGSKPMKDFGSTMQSICSESSACFSYRDSARSLSLGFT